MLLFLDLSFTQVAMDDLVAMLDDMPAFAAQRCTLGLRSVQRRLDG